MPFVSLREAARPIIELLRASEALDPTTCEDLCGKNLSGSDRQLTVPLTR